MTAFSGLGPLFRGRLGRGSRPSSRPPVVLFAASRGHLTMRTQLSLLIILLIATGLVSCGEALAVPPGVAATPDRPAASPEAEVPAVVLVAPPRGDGASASVTPGAPGAPAALSTPAAESRRTESTATQLEVTGEAHMVKRTPLARDRLGRVIGRAPKKANRPTVSQGTRGSKNSAPFRGRKGSKAGAGAGRQQAAAAAAAAEKKAAAAGRPRQRR